MDDLNLILQQQVAYYQARASEYDQWFLRQGRYDHGAELNQQWFLEVEQVRQVLIQFNPRGEILELACGTGLWTQHLEKVAQKITAVDAAPEVLQLNEKRLGSSKVTYQQANIFSLQPAAQVDVVFFSFWLSHVPDPLFEPFWKMVGSALKPGGRVFFIDSRYEPTSTARDHQLNEIQPGMVQRRLNDGQEFQIVKIFYQPEALMTRLEKLGWKIRVHETTHYFLYGEGGMA